jgi:hypothetical protein
MTDNNETVPKNYFIYVSVLALILLCLLVYQFFQADKNNTPGGTYDSSKLQQALDTEKPEVIAFINDKDDIRLFSPTAREIKPCGKINSNNQITGCAPKGKLTSFQTLSRGVYVGSDCGFLFTSSGVFTYHRDLPNKWLSPCHHPH